MTGCVASLTRLQAFLTQAPAGWCCQASGLASEAPRRLHDSRILTPTWKPTLADLDAVPGLHRLNDELAHALEADRRMAARRLYMRLPALLAQRTVEADGAAVVHASAETLSALEVSPVPRVAWAQEQRHGHDIHARALQAEFVQLAVPARGVLRSRCRDEISTCTGARGLRAAQAMYQPHAFCSSAGSASELAMRRAAAGRLGRPRRRGPDTQVRRTAASRFRSDIDASAAAGVPAVRAATNTQPRRC